MYLLRVITFKRTLRFGYSNEEMAQQRMKEWAKRSDVYRVDLEKLGKFILGQSMQGGGNR